MNNYLLRIKDGLIISFTMLFVFSVVGTIYAARNNVSKVSSQDLLTSTAWNNMIDNVDYLKGGLVIPTGLVSAFYTTSCPIGWKAADGSNGTPDLRGKFIRGLNNFNGTNGTLAGVDADKDGSTRTLGSYQSDTIRNMTGSTFWIQNDAQKISGLGNGLGGTGIFLVKDSTNVNGYTNSSNYVYQPNWIISQSRASNLVSETLFDASRVVPTGSDNRPKNVALIYCIKE